MIEGELLPMISQVGFPIAVCVYLLFSRDKVLKEMAGELKNLSVAVNNQTIALVKRG